MGQYNADPWGRLPHSIRKYYPKTKKRRSEPAAEPEDTLIEETIKSGHKRILEVVEKNRNKK